MTTGERLKRYMDAHPDATYRQAARACGLASASTVHHHVAKKSKTAKQAERIAELEAALRWALNHLYNANPYYGGVETDEICQRWDLLENKGTKE